MLDMVWVYNGSCTPLVKMSINTSILYEDTFVCRSFHKVMGHDL